jgi:3-hydroxyacyl-CoA dehydrogenase/enoyl-CoA hydratase/3-hydroxybutyryl-CoA epimerase
MTKKNFISGASRPKNVKPTEVKKLGVLGSGLMGHGITYVSALSGLNLIMTDATQENADKGLSRIKVILNEELKQGRTTKGKMDEILSRITATADYDKLRNCDLIIEAVFEDRNLKGKVTAKAEKVMDSNGVFASNTSTLPITGLAEKSIRPEKFIGIHFFSPVHKMKLVEIIKGYKTNDETIAKAFDYVLKIKKIPIVVNDSRGFYTSRVFSTYPNEGLALLAEGNSPQEIESAGKKAGMPVGPLAVIDEVNIGLVAGIRNQTRKDLAAEGKKLPPGPADPVIDLMTEKLNRLGRANGRGFYEYPDNGKKYLWPELQKHFPPTKNPLSQNKMMERMLFVQVIETIRCYEENVVTSVEDANIGSIFGWGFAPLKGGTLQFVNDYGIQEFEKQAQKLAKKYGERFAPPELLIEMAANNQTF